jgi:hypothetical protein
MTGVSGREKRRAEERLRACGALRPDEEISGAVEAVTFNDTVGELGRSLKKVSMKTGLFRWDRNKLTKSSPTS